MSALLLFPDELLPGDVILSNEVNGLQRPAVVLAAAYREETGLVHVELSEEGETNVLSRRLSLGSLIWVERD